MAAEYMPRLRSDKRRYALEEAVPSPTDVSPGNPGIAKQTFNVPVAIDENDLLITLRSDSMDHLHEVVDWLTGRHRLGGSLIPAPAFAGLLQFTSARLMFAQRGMPRKVAETHGLPFATRIPPASPMWLGFADQHVTASGPASVVTFQGDGGAPFTDTKTGDYFYNGSVQHLSHVILDLAQWYDEPFSERVQ